MSNQISSDITIKIKNDSPLIVNKNTVKKLSNGNNIQNIVFELGNLDVDNSTNLQKEIKSNLTSTNTLFNKLPNSVNKNLAINNFINNNNVLSNTLINNNKDKNNSGCQFLTNKSNCNQKNHFNIYKEDMNLMFIIYNSIKLKILCCFKNNKNSKYNNLSLINWYYIYLLQSERYLEIVKQFIFIKKLILNNEQNRSLLFLKKINLNDENEKEDLLNLKNNNFENSVVSYYNDLLKNANKSITQTDWFIMDNLSANLKKNIIYYTN